MERRSAVNIQNSRFVTSAASPGAFIRDGKPQLVFAGRSNVGKSSVINRLVNMRGFAKVSGTPGKTAHVNYFLLDDGAYLADLPGYGYAKVSDAERRRWGELMEAYFDSGLVTAGFLIVDSRHKPTADDVTMAGWFAGTGTPVVVVANKLDKLKKSEVEPNLARIADTLGVADVLPFSAETGLNRDALVNRLAGFF
ncbi:MAG: ribosome biogenesis GTP-binding protein YihA/YsxC [Oscillospiraceae bacterium]|jgi:GTP-binding protein|nr:ribosome biogenesis GTP-binding protein YihA/YsxC [Oscillospiraceae bacterium]